MDSPQKTFPFNVHIDRQKYVNIDESSDTSSYDIIQPKYDGIWGLVKRTASGNVEILSRTGAVKSILDAGRFPPSTVLVGEFMFGSQWAQHKDRIGRIFVFDALALDGKDLRSLPYSERLKVARDVVAVCGYPFELTKSYHANLYRNLWARIDATRDFEGVVFRKWSDDYSGTIGRRKIDITDDYVIIDFVAGQGKHQGRLGALVVGQFINGTLQSMMSVGGGFDDALREEIWLNRKQYYLSVCEVVGKARFESGALRHPNFLRFRHDKSASECVYDNGL